MVIKVFPSHKDSSGSLTMDVVMAMALLTAVLLPVSFSFVGEQKILRADYHRALAMEIVDGEMEILVAGEWHEFPEGEQGYSVNNPAAKNLPAGEFKFSRSGTKLKLEWRGKSKAGHVMREAVGK